MRILAIGLGGAGCRIAAALYANDRKSSKVACVQALAVDVDHETIAKLTALPERSKICFEALDAGLSMNGKETAPTPRIDITEIVARIQNREGEDPDAIIICCGLGGSMTEIAPHLIAALRASVTEPLFGLVTLPCLSEGERRSAKAADDIEAISPLLDGTLLFDNETWVKKVAKRRDTLVKEMSHASEGFLGFGKSQPKLTAREITDKLLNQSIVRRISLILRAGEFRADGGIDLAEVVMDSSEVLNTMMGMGFITIGYAVEYLHNKPLAFLSRLRPENETEEQRKSAERIIDLAKQAIYQEVSIPCDMTSASKALILLAGPSHEISMKGFMTVRSWIDRSIAGMETRSGDYPVTNTKYVAIIVMLSGIENIPRVNQLKEIRDQYRFGGSRSAGSASEPLRDVGQKSDRFSAGSVSDVAASWKNSDISDDMIVMPGSSPKRGGAYDRVQERGTPRNPERERIPSQRGNINTGNPSPYQAGTGARAPREFYQEQPRAPVRERPMVRSEPVQNQRPAPVRPPVNQSVPPVPRHRTLPQEPQGNLRPVPRQQFTTTNPRLPQGNTVRRNL
ncbi:MAG: cell division protein, partial [Methanoregula sp.]|nr:cell division protein [Methanoregula sp.]